MCKKKRIATIFAQMENIHLIKDPGMIPLTFHRYYGYQATIPLSSTENYPYKDKYYSGVETPLLSDKKNVDEKYLVRLKWLIKNAKKIDVLHLFFFDKWTFILMYIYKVINRKGLIYVHADTDGERLIHYNFSRNPIKRFITTHIFLNDRVLEDTLWGIQNSKNAKRLEGVWPFIHVKFVPNGFFWEGNSKPEYNQKENIILTVARLGTPPKKTDLLLEAFAKVSPQFPDWKLRLVGTIEDEFKEYIEKFFARNPGLKDKVEFVGPIYDRNALEQEYIKAKVFCLPSAYESFGLVSVEALSKGCFLLESDIESNKDITQNGKMGLLFENGNPDDFAEKMKCTLSDETRLEHNFTTAVRYANSHFSWERALEPVALWLEEKRGKAE